MLWAGDAYASKWKFVIAVFRDFSSKEPDDFAAIVEKEPQFITTFLIHVAIKQGLFSVVANVPVPVHLRQFPIFRGTNNLKGEDTMWFFWDGSKEWKVHRPLSDNEKKFPEGPSLPSAPLSARMIENDYRVDRDYI